MSGRGEVPLPGDHEPIVGPRLRLKPLEEADLPGLWRWLGDPEVRRFYGERPDSIGELREDYLERGVNPVWRFVIEEDGEGIGEIQYGHPYPGAEFVWTAAVDILIGEPGARDRGLGTEAVRTMLSYLFGVRGIHIVMIDPEVANARAIRAYEKAGFRADGVLRHHAFKHGRYVDAYMMSIISDEWPAERRRWEAERPRSV